MGAIDAVPCCGARLAFFLRRRNNHTPKPMSARPSMGPTTAPAIHAFDPEPGSEVDVGPTLAVEGSPGIEVAMSSERALMFALA